MHYYFKDCLKDLGFHSKDNSDCVFDIESGKQKVYILVYVDDLLIYGKGQYPIYDVKSNLVTKLRTHNLGSVKDF